MKPIPMDRRVLIHKIKWIPKRLSVESNEGFVIDKVRLTWKHWYNPIADPQTVNGNWILYYDYHFSGKLPDGSVPKFSIGDSIEFLSAPLFPKVCSINFVNPFYMQGSDAIQHLEITLG